MRERPFILINEDGAIASLTARTREAAARHAGFFLAIHHDSAQQQFLESWQWLDHPQNFSDRFSGFSLFVSRKNPEQERSRACASAIGRELRRAGFHPTEHHAMRIAGESKSWSDRENGVYYYDDLVVLKSAAMPAVLLEAGVIINRADELELALPATRARIAEAVALGLNACGVS